MSETPQQRRTRLIEQYAGQIYASGKTYIIDVAPAATQLADTVIAATPQEPQSTRYPSEIETRLIVLVEYCLAASDPLPRTFILRTLQEIKRDLGVS